MGVYRRTPAAPEQPYLVMDMLAGETLYALFKREAPLPPARLLDLLLPVLSGVAAAHRKGVVHRDLKPENVFLDQSSGPVQPRVLDFGIAKLVGAPGATRAGVVFGTYEYLAPELVSGSSEASAHSDQYALGVMLYEGASARLPFPYKEGEDLRSFLGRVLLVAPPPLTQYRPELPEAFAEVLHRTLAKEPAERFPSIEELGQALLPFASPRARILYEEDFVTEEQTVVQVAVRPPSPGPASEGPPSIAPMSTTVPPGRWHLLHSALFGALLAVVLGGGVVLLRERGAKVRRAPKDAGTAATAAAAPRSGDVPRGPAPAPPLPPPPAPAVPKPLTLTVLLMHQIAGALEVRCPESRCRRPGTACKVVLREEKGTCVVSASGRKPVKLDIAALRRKARGEKVTETVKLAPEVL